MSLPRWILKKWTCYLHRTAATIKEIFRIRIARGERSLRRLLGKTLILPNMAFLVLDEAAPPPPPLRLHIKPLKGQSLWWLLHTDGRSEAPYRIFNKFWLSDLNRSTIFSRLQKHLVEFSVGSDYWSVNLQNLYYDLTTDQYTLLSY